MLAGFDGVHLGHGIDEGEDDGLWSHGCDVLAGEQARSRDADEDVRPSQHLLERAVQPGAVGVLGDPTTELVHALVVNVPMAAYLGTVPAPTASFTTSVASGIAPLSVTMTDTSTGTPTSWAWTLGNGTTSTVQNPVATYATAGTYTVPLTASNASGASALRSEPARR